MFHGQDAGGRCEKGITLGLRHGGKRGKDSITQRFPKAYKTSRREKKRGDSRVACKGFRETRESYTQGETQRRFGVFPKRRKGRVVGASTNKKKKRQKTSFTPHAKVHKTADETKHSWQIAAILGEKKRRVTRFIAGEVRVRMAQSNRNSKKWGRFKEPEVVRTEGPVACRLIPSKTAKDRVRVHPETGAQRSETNKKNACC